MCHLFPSATFVRTCTYISIYVFLFCFILIFNIKRQIIAIIIVLFSFQSRLDTHDVLIYLYTNIIFPVFKLKALGHSISERFVTKFKRT